MKLATTTFLSLMWLPLWAQANRPLPAVEDDTLLDVQLHMAQQVLTLEVAHEKAEIVYVELYNTEGIRVYEAMLSLTDGRSDLQLNLAPLKNGQLVLRCYAEQEVSKKPYDVVLTKEFGSLTQK